MTVNKVELRTAYAWTCETCGRDNFEQAVVHEMSDDDREWMRIQYGISECETGDFVTRPDEVTCQHCGATFETTDPHTDED